MPGGVDGFNDLPTKIGRNVGVVPGAPQLVWCWILQRAAHPGSIELGYQHNGNLMVRNS